ncbi:DUF4440 domain-containing protein [Caulobacter sp.]|uniref:DUF4440 domain-containing protein n=1 Tax=Caulobacter sp. TaxID=78 RepID=UPI001B22E2F0|nr:DUF4440 domain-containing protein [Caulobacter sp.]MBO9546001.1 nuclear transport factor 2 family protein [Caulobacter sp.]
MLKTVLTAIVALTAANTALAETKTPGRQIEAAERAFAADGAAMGIRASFLKHMAPDAIVFSPGPVNARVFYGAQSGEGEPKIAWWPAFVVASKSGDLGLSTGPTQFDGRPGGWFSSIWRKDADGTWRWVYDGGGVADSTSAPAQTTPAVMAPVATQGEASPAKAFEAVSAAEAGLAAAALTDTAAAYRAVLSDNAHMLGPNGMRTLTPTATSERLAKRPATTALTLRGGGASKAGDLVWTHGEARWTTDAQKSAAAHYMHVWQRRPEGWRLIFEALINDR